MTLARMDAGGLVPVKSAPLAVVPPETRDPAGCEQVVDKLFAELKVAFPAWKQAFQDRKAETKAKAIWAKAMFEQGVVTIEQVQLGMRVARRSRSAFFPAVGEFVSWCQPTAQELGIPSPERALEIVCGDDVAGCSLEYRWQHPLVFHAAKDSRLVLYSLRRAPMAGAMRIWGPIYEEYSRRLAAGEPFSFPELVEDNPRRRVSDDERQASRAGDLTRLRSMLSELGGCGG